MIRKLLLHIATAGVLICGAVDANAAPCKDAKGKFIKCPPPAAAAVAPANVKKDAKGRCHVASGPKKGQFTKC